MADERRMRQAIGAALPRAGVRGGRETWLRLANEAARDPSRAAQIARVLLDHIDTDARTGEVAPEGYLYAGAHTLIARERNLEVESLEGPSNPTGVPIWNTNRVAIPIKVPFDIWIYGVAGWAVPQISAGTGGIGLALVVPTAADGRDLFSTSWGLDGQVEFGTDGRQAKMAPASVRVGTRLRPRPMSWLVRRNQRITVKFRNLFNAIAPNLPVEQDPIVLSEAAIAFYAVNLEAA